MPAPLPPEILLEIGRYITSLATLHALSRANHIGGFTSEFNPNSAVQIAAWQGDVELVRMCLQPEYWPGSDGDPTPRQLQDAFRSALVNGKREVLPLLIGTGMDLNWHFHDPHPGKFLSSSPLLWAVEQNDVELVQWILENKNVEIIHLLLPHSTNWHHVWTLAISMGNADEQIARILLEHGMPPELRDADRPPREPDGAASRDVDPLSPLARAIFSRHLGLVQLLVEYGVNVNANGGELEELASAGTLL
ncbi:hypothetical protein BDW74DRAFT_179200 [Aspergillus multicolor]|uniref:ankyrin repeat domain-containing protein n=1 Tax=Aspergillus multicolor TaxID=41759 RepID=UPI003CCD4565